MSQYGSGLMFDYSDEQIIEEAARRLQLQFSKETGDSLLYGSFRFIFHDGRFQGVEDWPRNKRYLSPLRFASIKTSSNQG